MLAARTAIRAAAGRATGGGGTFSGIQNSFEGGSNTTAITTGNSGGASGSALDIVAGTVTYSATRSRGSLSAALANGSSQVGWNSTTLGSGVTDAYGRGYFYLTGNPSGLLLAQVFHHTAGAVTIGFCAIQSNGKLGIYNTSGALQASSTNTVPLNAWFRIEATVHSHATAGSMSVRLYATDNVTLTETLSASSINTNGATIDKMYVQGQNGVSPLYVDDIAYSTSGWIGA